MLTTTEAAEVAAVAPSTIKRWADQGILPFSRTAGGHRRFERFVVERLLREQPVPRQNPMRRPNGGINTSAVRGSRVFRTDPL
jgi:excisionase family DNA binding protein